MASEASAHAMGDLRAAEQPRMAAREILLQQPTSMQVLAVMTTTNGGSEDVGPA
jgi:hypothetical protein